MKTERVVKFTVGAETEPLILRDASALGSLLPEERRAEEVVSVRTAKATLSALLEKVAAGCEVLITSDGRPKARLVPVERPRMRRVFPGSAAHLAQMPAWRGGPESTELISADRDERGE